MEGEAERIVVVLKRGVKVREEGELESVGKCDRWVWQEHFGVNGILSLSYNYVETLLIDGPLDGI